MATGVVGTWPVAPGTLPACRGLLAEGENMGKFTTTIEISSQERDVLREALRWQGEPLEGLQATLEYGNPYGWEQVDRERLAGVIDLGDALGWPLEGDADRHSLLLTRATIDILESMRGLEVQNIVEDEAHETSEAIVAVCDRIIDGPEAALVRTQAQGNTVADLVKEAA